MMRLAGLDLGYIHERMKKDNPEGNYLVETMRKGVGQLRRGDSELRYGFRINQLGSRIDSEEG
jgi:hypothetical protein